jgi:hypothetical protein
MSQVELRFLASREWMESEILSGRPIQHRVQVLAVNLDEIDPTLAHRIEEIRDGVMLVKVGEKRHVCVLDSGIDPELSFGPSKKKLLRFDQPVIDAVGFLPELPTPTDNVEEVIAAWEGWLKRYKAEGLKVIEALNLDPPKVGHEDYYESSISWGELTVSFGPDLWTQINPDAGAPAVRDARAGLLWEWAARKRFSSDSVSAAKEAVGANPAEIKGWLTELTPGEMAARYVEQARKTYLAAKAHDAARSEIVLSFETEMKRWAEEQGSARLRLGIEDGYRMNARYLTERIAVEAPGMYAMPAQSAPTDWANKATSPSEAALRLRRRVAASMKRNAPKNADGCPETEIVIIRKPPHEIYLADSGSQTEYGVVGDDLPSRKGWNWYVDEDGEVVDLGPKPVEAVVVRHWLGRFHLIGAVNGGDLDIWAVPNPEHFGEDGLVIAQDPDGPAPDAARRKPPESADDIPF